MNIYRNKIMRREWIVATLLACCSVSAAAPATDKTAEADSGNWDVTLGAGVLVKPQFYGSDENETLVLPYFEFTWKDRVTISAVDGLRARVYANDRLRIDGGIGFDFGRDQDDDIRLLGLGDVEFAPTARLGAEYRLGPVATFVDVNKHVGGTDGLEVEVGATVAMPLAARRGAFMAINLSAEYADDKYMNGYFGVDAAQSARSGLRQYSPDAGFNAAGANVLVMYPLTAHWALNALGSYTKIIGDAADSPTVLKRDQFALGLFAAYRY